MISLSIEGIGWKNMPSEVSSAGAISDREPTAQELKRQLAEARDQQNATREILDVMALSPSNAQPVFDAIARSARRLCDGFRSAVYGFDGTLIHNIAHDNWSAEGLAALARVYPRPPSRETQIAQSILEGRVVHVPDMDASGVPEQSLMLAQALGYRSILAVPMLRGGKSLGAIAVVRTEAGAFSEGQIEVVKTFAGQAVIAIENTRLFEAERSSKRELQQSLQQQTATSEVLKSISRSVFDLQAVLGALVESAAKLCGGDDVSILRLSRNKLTRVAHCGSMKAPPAYVIPASPGTVSGRSVLERRPIHVTDLQSESDTYPEGSAIARELGHRTLLVVPLLREGTPLGVITLRRNRVEPFSDKQIELVTTFADQAVIAIENTRLFEEVQERTHELQQSLEYQTATSDVLGVISRSPSELQPVLNVIVTTAAKLCEGFDATILLRDGDRLRVGAHHGGIPLDFESMELGRGWITGRAVLDRQPVHVHDLAAARDQFPEGHDLHLRHGHRTGLAVPLMRDDQSIGAFMIRRMEVRPFSHKQISLLQTFADQAVIAIENTRLFEEVQARNRDLTALGEVGRAVSSTLDLKVVLKTIVERAVELSGTDAGSIFYHRPESVRFELGETVGLDAEVVRRFRKLDIATGQTGLGEAIANRQPLQIADVMRRPSNAVRNAVLEAGLNAALIVPLLGGEGAIGALVLLRRPTGEFPAPVISLMQSFADQSAIALENARLFQEIAQKSRELETASQHKSQFVANMSHELRTPLAAILGYAELMQEGFYEPLGPKSMDALTRIRSNGKHLLGLINTVLDAAKIESGQFTLNMAEYAIESVVETVRSATESLAQNKKLAFNTEIAKPLPIGLGDEQRLTQVLLNLVGNAIKFTDAGEVRVTAKAVNGRFAVSVADTGPGIPDQERTRIFAQFHQIDDTNTKAKGGTGLGLAIAKQIVELHGGRIWVESTVGKGSTFQMELPTRANQKQEP
jgi:signal transduction histidine kinase/putative methionine-R-sulfoxide reductase with GAF domain